MEDSPERDTNTPLDSLFFKNVANDATNQPVSRAAALREPTMRRGDVVSGAAACSGR